MMQPRMASALIEADVAENNDRGASEEHNVRQNDERTPPYEVWMVPKVGLYEVAHGALRRAASSRDERHLAVRQLGPTQTVQDPGGRADV